MKANPLDVLRATTVALSLLDRRSAPHRWECTTCQQTFAEPSFSDASDVFNDPDTGPTLQHVVVCLCPFCFSETLRMTP